MCSRPGRVYSTMAALESSAENLAERDHARVEVEKAPQLLEKGEILGLGVVVEVVLVGVGVVRREADCATSLARLRRIVAQQQVVEAEVDRIESKAVDAALEPEPDVVERSAADVGLVEVEVRLVG